MPGIVRFYSRARFTWVLVGLMVAGYCGGAALTPFLALDGSLSALLLRPWTVLTYLFAHVSIYHLLTNVAALLTVGAFCEGDCGVRRLLAVFFSSGLSGAAFFLIFASFSPAQLTLCGASAAIFGLCAFSFCLSEFLSRSFLIKILILCGALVVTPQNIAGGFAHLGGIAAGAACWLVFKRKINSNPSYEAIIKKSMTSGFASLTDNEKRQITAK